MAQAANEQLRAAHILKKHCESRNPVSRNPAFSKVDIPQRSVKDAEAMLVALLKDINSQKDAGAKTHRFLELASQESDCGSFQNGGDLGAFSFEQMQRQFSEATSGLKVGEWTQAPVLSDSGSHLILRLPLGFKNPFDRKAQKAQQADEVRVCHILSKHEGSRRLASWRDPDGKEIKKRKAAEADAILQGHLAQLDKLGDVNEQLVLFNKIAKESSDCSSAQKGGDLGYFSFAKMQKPFSEASFALEIGQISGIVHSASGSHIIMRIG